MLGSPPMRASISPPGTLGTTFLLAVLATLGACLGPRHDARYRRRHRALDLWKLTRLPAFRVLALESAFALSHALTLE